MKQAASLKGVEIPLLLPGIKINTSATDFYPIQSVRLAALQGRDLRAVRRHPVRRGGIEVSLSCRANRLRQLALYKRPTGHTLPGGLFYSDARTVDNGTAHRLHFPPALVSGDRSLDAAAFDQRVARAASGLRGARRAPGRLRRAAAAQRLRFSGSLARRRAHRRLCRPDQLAFQGRRGRLHPGGLRRQGAGCARRPARPHRRLRYPPA